MISFSKMQFRGCQLKIIQPVLSDPKERGGIWPILGLRVHMYIYIYMYIYEGVGLPKSAGLVDMIV